LLVSPVFAGEFAILSSGLRLHIERHETSGQSVRLFTSADSFSDVPSSAISAFEQEDYVPPPVPPVVDPPAPAIAVAIHADPKTMVHDAAIRYGLPPKFVESVAKIESAMRPDAISPKGAIGVMQLMPATAKALDADPNNSAQNIEAGTKLLRELLIKYNNDAVKALAAYNAGEGAVDRFGGLPPFPETQSYVDKVIKSFKAADK
jgi:soluble lytic murein transglycosylase-like protein